MTWNHCYKDARRPYGTINYKLVELRMFGSCESSNSDIDSGSDSFSSPISQKISSNQWRPTLLSTLASRT